MRKTKINPLLESIILNIVKLLTIKNEKKIGRPPVCSSEDYLDGIFYVLKHGIGWEYLNGYPVSGDSFRKKFKEWQSKEVFKSAWLIVLRIYEKYKIDFKDLFIDASHIKNQFGSEFVGSNIYDRFRKATKLTIIVDEFGIPVSIKIGPSNKHDSKYVIPSIESLQINISDVECLIADKGYVSKDLSKKLADIYSIQLVTPRKKRKKQKGKLRGRKPKNHGKLKNRFIVEHSLSWFKQYTRLFRRKDKKINIFLEFIYFGAANLISNKLTNYILN